MSFWAPFMNDFKENEKMLDKMQKENKTKEEIELEEIRERINFIEKRSMPSAEMVREYFSLKEKIEYLEEENKYKEWFDNNKETINCFFGMMFEDFKQNYNNGYIAVDFYKKSGNIEYKYIELNYKFLKKLLERYGYTVITNCSHQALTGEVKIYYNKEGDF